jgi:hypothetical protein
MLVVFVWGFLGKRPVVLVPGMMGSRFNGTVTRRPYWYCPHIKDGPVWLRDDLIPPPLFRCMLSAMAQAYDPTKAYPVEKEGVNVYSGTGALGDVDSTCFVDDLFGEYLIPTFEFLAQRFESRGWTRAVDLFGLSNDWRPRVLHPPVGRRASGGPG